MTPEQFQRVQHLFQRGLAFPEEERDAFLRAQCPDDVLVRTKVERMLSYAQAQGRSKEESADAAFLESPALGRGFHVGPVADMDRRISEEFERAGRFRLIDRIGEGGFGSVYRAEQLEPVRRELAIKVIKPGMDTRRVLSRFEAERQTLARMNHPGIAAVYDAGVTESGRSYFAMELVGGEPITGYCDSASLEVRARLGLFLRVCAAVQHAHQKGIIHRDLKPSNVIVTTTDGAPAPKVIDFGIAKAIGGDASDVSMATEEGQLVGTPEYMSPEQALGNPDIDTRADVYSLGVLLYELLTGSTPIDRRDSPAIGTASAAQLRRLITEFEPRPPSTRLRTMGERVGAVAGARGADAPALVRQVRGDLDWIVMHAIEPDRDRRYGSVADLAADVNRYLHDEEVTARPPTAAYRASKFARRHKLALIASGAVGLALIAGMVGTTVGLFQAIAARDAEADQRRRADDEAATAVAIASFVNDDLLSAASPEQSGEDVSIRQVLDAAAGKIDGRFPDRPLVEAGVRAVMGSSYMALGMYDKAEPQIVRAHDLRHAALGPNASGTLDARRSLGQLRSDQARYDEADSLLSGVVAARRAAHGEDKVAMARDLHVLARNLVRQARNDEAERVYREVVDLTSAIHGPDHRETLIARTNLIGLLQNMGRVDDLEPQLQSIMASQARVLGPEHPHTLFTHNRLAGLAYHTKRFDEAEARYLAVIKAMNRVFGPENTYTLYAIGDLCNVYQAQGRLEEAEKKRLMVVDGLTRSLGADHAETLIAREQLGDVYYAQKRYAEAAAVFEAVLTANRAAFGPEHEYTRASQLRLARTYMKLEQYAQAERVAAPLIPASRKPGDDKLLEPLLIRARALVQLDRASEAEPLLRELISATPTARNQRARVEARTSLVALYEAAGRVEEAAALREQAE